jgi:hypothetical protein
MPPQLLDSAEIVIGLVAPVGTDLSVVTEELEQAFKLVSYQTRVIRLSRLLRELRDPEIASILANIDDHGPADERTIAYMDAGDRFCELFCKDAMARLAIGAMRDERDVLADILDRLQRGGWLTGPYASQSVEDLLATALDGAQSAAGHLVHRPVMKGAHFMNLIEFMRPVHAEMASMCDAVRRSTAINGCTLYVRTMMRQEQRRYGCSAAVAT